MKTRLNTRLSLLVWVLAILLLASTFTQAQINPSRIAGTIVLEDGTPLAKVKLHFEPEQGSSRSGRDLKVGKKGKFMHNFFPAGTYTISLVGDEYFIKHMKWTATKPSGEPWEDLETDAHPKDGLPPIALHGNARNKFELIAASAASRKKMVQDLDIAESSSELQAASDLFNSGDMEGVLRETAILLAEKPDLGPALYLRGVAMHRTGKLDEAAELLAKAIAIVPDQPGIHGVCGSITMDMARREEKLGKDEAAKSSFSDAADLFAQELEADPISLAALTSRAIALEGAGRNDEALVALESLLAADPQNIGVYFSLASLYRKSGQTDKALEILSSVPSGGKDAAPAIYNVCTKLYNENDYESVIIALGKALEIDPDFALAHHLLGYTYLASGEKAKAIESFEKFLEMAPDHSEAARDREMVNALK